jgi:hypothetical protein
VNSSSNIRLPNLRSVNYNSEILAKLNTLKTVLLNYEDTNINIEFYHNSTDDPNILNININKLITRLWNLLVLFKNKNVTSKKTKFIFYLYNNVKRANKKDNTVSDYFERLNTSVCFNCVNGLTEPKYSIISRFEESAAFGSEVAIPICYWSHTILISLHTSRFSICH